ncbi:MAG: DUF4394 domain-containing protein [Blastocatellia bacterium]|nr:DUF4394 domain-containing protein [Blastocatellia bacterium]
MNKGVGAAMQNQARAITLPNTAIYALNNDNTIFVLKPGTRAFTRLGRVNVNKIDGNLIGIDFRPADGNGNALHGLTDTGNVYQISLVAPTIGEPTFVSKTTTRFSGGYQSLMDFNPTLNALRLIGANDQNLAMVNSSGNLNVTAAQTPMAYAQGDVNQGVDPNIAGGTYSNNYAGAPNTLFYGIDFDLDTFVTISSVNATGSSNTGGGQLQTIGPIVDQNNQPINLAPTADLDIYTDSAKVNFLVGISGRRLFTIDLAQLTPNLPLGQTQKVVALGINVEETGGGFIDIAVSPFGPAPTATPTPAPTATPTPTPTPTATPAVTGTSYQAEAATLGGGNTVKTNQAGFTGAGFVDFADNVAGGFVEFALTDTGVRTLKFRYANGSAAGRTLSLSLNGMVLTTLNFAPTGAWTTWKTVTVPNVNLGAAAGAKALRLTATTAAGGPNLDRLIVQ